MNEADDRILTAILSVLDARLDDLQYEVFTSNIKTIEGFKGIEGHYRGLQEARQIIVTEITRRDDDD